MISRWVEISTRCERDRFIALSDVMNKAGLENSVEFIETDLQNYENILQDAFLKFDQIRIGGELRDVVPSFLTHFPSSLLTLKSSDAFVKEQGTWWPRNFLVNGIQRAIVSSGIRLELNEGIFVFGAGPDARAVIAALCGLGFKRFTLCDPDDKIDETFLADLRKSYFLVQFNAVPRHMITQLPSTNSFAVNTLQARDDSAGESGALAELFYFNFLKPGGVWLDLPLAASNALLEEEARAVNAVVASAVSVAACTDTAWVESCWKDPKDPSKNMTIDYQIYADALTSLKSAQPS